ncbi:MAG: hypothetical protein KDD19_05935 [Phaeodactylibacter sp.]|nr:hypothetical protein [Phaeodactylibacter sp.]MCB9048298.1 hypothetical protein [Lewinellaceae bacterium]
MKIQLSLLVLFFIPFLHVSAQNIAIGLGHSIEGFAASEIDGGYFGVQMELEHRAGGHFGLAYRQSFSWNANGDRLATSMPSLKFYFKEALQSAYLSLNFGYHSFRYPKGNELQRDGGSFGLSLGKSTAITDRLRLGGEVTTHLFFMEEAEAIYYSAGLRLSYAF